MLIYSKRRDLVDDQDVVVVRCSDTGMLFHELASKTNQLLQCVGARVQSRPCQLSALSPVDISRDSAKSPTMPG